MRAPKLVWQPVVIAAAASACCLLPLYLHPNSISALDARIFDVLVGALPPHKSTGNVVIVDIDPPSLSRIGRWPWSCAVMAKLINRLHSAKAAVVALNLVYREPCADSGNSELKKALGHGHNAIGYGLIFKPAPELATCSALPRPVPYPRTSQIAAAISVLPQAEDLICDEHLLSFKPASSGFVNIERDPDRAVRRLPLFAAYQGFLLPSFALAAHQLSTPAAVAFVGNQPVVQVGNQRLHLAETAGLLLHYCGTDHCFPYHSAEEVLTQDITPNQFSGKIVVVGSAALTFQQLVETANDRDFPASEVQATAIDNLLAGDFFYRPRWAAGVETALVIPAAALAVFILFRFAPPVSLFGATSFAALLWATSQAALFFTGAFLSPLLPMTASLIALGAFAIRGLLVQDNAGRRSQAELAMANHFITSALGAITALRDVETGQHVVRIQGYLRSLCQVAATKPRFRSYLTPKTIDLLVQLAAIHDIGKVGVPDHILHKPGTLSPDEFELMKSHVDLGKKILEEARARSRMNSQFFFQTAVDIVYSHHERWDGSGYPLGLAGDQIPIPGRLLAVADVYDALISKRHYKTGVLHADAVELIRRAAGAQFDPEIVDCFLTVQHDWRRMAESHRDNPTQAASAP